MSIIVNELGVSVVSTDYAAHVRAHYRERTKLRDLDTTTAIADNVVDVTDPSRFIRSYATAVTIHMLRSLGKTDATTDIQSGSSQLHVGIQLDGQRRVSQHDVDDIVQSAFLLYWRARGDGKPICTLRAVQHAYQTYKRSRRFDGSSRCGHGSIGTQRQAFASMDQAAVEDSEYWETPTVNHGKRQSFLNRVIDLLSTGLSSRDIAKRLHVDRKTIDRAITTLRNEFSRDEFLTERSRQGIPYATIPHRPMRRRLAERLRLSTRPLRKTKYHPLPVSSPCPLPSHIDNGYLHTVALPPLPMSPHYTDKGFICKSYTLPDGSLHTIVGRSV